MYNKTRLIFRRGWTWESKLKKIACLLLGGVCGLFISSSVFAEDVGRSVVFPHARYVVSPKIPARSQEIIYDSGASVVIAQPWDTALINGDRATPGTLFQISRSDERGHWSDWKMVAPHVFPGGRFWVRASLYLGPGAIRIRILRSAENAAPSIHILGASVFKASPENGRSPFRLAVYHPSSRQSVWPNPRVHSRREWHARRPTHAYSPSDPHFITIHHTAGAQTHSLASTLREVRFIQDFQMDGRGWWDIGYHFLVDANGHIIEGRPENVEGSHTKDYNTNNVGIALLGDYNSPANNRVTPAQMKALTALVRYLSSKYGIPPSNIKGHRDYDQTACPGSDAYIILPELRASDSWNAPRVPNEFIEALAELKSPLKWDLILSAEKSN